jgi:phenylacetate-coenzyme A ligase PaaK-like adenylate-forming protein
MPDLENAYSKLPVAFQHAACSVAGRRADHRRLGGAFSRMLAEAEDRSFSSPDDIRAFRDARLRAFVRHCFDNVPFYRHRLEEAGIGPDAIRGLDDMARLPVLTKHEVKDHSSDLMFRGMPRRRMRKMHTSGTTGGGLRFATSADAIREQWAVWWRYRRWHGLRRGTWCGHFAGRTIVPLSQHEPPFWRYNVPGRQIVFSGYHMGPESLPAYVDELRNRRPPWLHGYPSLLALLAAHIVESGQDLGYEVEWITTGAENLLPQQSLLMSQAFGVRPVQHYGMAEAVANISECDRGALHVDEDFAAVEFVPQGHQTHKIVGTNFTNPITPFLRYQVEDVVTIDGGASCGCGRPGRTITRVDGRLEDYVVLGNGAKVGRMDHIFKDLVNVREAQIRQSRRGEITIRVVRMPDYTHDDELAIVSETEKRVGADTQVTLEYVERLERSPAGKLRFVVSELAEGALEPPTA